MSQIDLAKKYQKKSDKQHILDNPDTYIGSIENVTTNCFIYDTSNSKICEKSIQFIPGLYKLFDEAIVNCRDHAIRMKQTITDEKNYLVNNIAVSIDNDGIITMFNDGNGIDVSIHPNIKWIPELIFANLRTSTNYDKQEKKLLVVKYLI